MSRLQKKCFIASGATHALLIVLLVVGPAFIPGRSTRDGDRFTVINVVGSLTDEATSGGARSERLSTPTPPSPPPAPTPPQSNPQVTDPAPPKPSPVPVKPEPPKPTPTRETESHESDFKPVSKPEVLKKPTDKGDEFKVVSRQSSGRVPPTANTNQHSTVQVAANNRVGQGLQDAVKNLNHSLARGSAVAIPVPGGGDGGPAMTRYSDLVYTIYYNAWQPLGVSDGALVAEARIVIARSGRVVSSEISKRSGNVELDKSVQSTLDKVTTLDPFPDNSKDLQRSYILEFDLSAKRQM